MMGGLVHLRLSFASLLSLASMVALLALGGCQTGTGTQTTCTEDAQCNEAFGVEGGFKCYVEEGICGCDPEDAANRACDSGEICNADGRCQARPGCITNDDCTEGEQSSLFCDVSSGECKSAFECQVNDDDKCCTIDSHCPFGNVCNILEGGRCVPGCRTDGDCLLGQGCVVEALGQLGQCEEGTCTANNLCQFGEICNLDEGQCVFDARGPYCFSCSGGVGSDDCGHPANYCLLDTSDPFGVAEFCGVDCAKGQPCPFGYDCNDVIILPPNLPRCSGPETCVKSPGAPTGYCSRNTAETCAEGEDCPEGSLGSDCPRANIGNCLVDQTQDCEEDVDCCEDASACPEGSCVKQLCRGGEGAAFGTCSCTRDLDCPIDSCKDADLTDPDNPILGNCELSGQDCYEDVDCAVIACIDGGCRIGANCAPANDRTCEELSGNP